MTRRDPAPDDVESAIERVLAAEALAASAVEAARAEASNHLEVSRARARHIAERAGARLQRLVLRIEANCQQQVDALDLAPPAHSDRSSDDAVLMARIVESIAAELTGGPP